MDKKITFKREIETFELARVYYRMKDNRKSWLIMITDDNEPVWSNGHHIMDKAPLFNQEQVDSVCKNITDKLIYVETLDFK